MAGISISRGRHQLAAVHTEPDEVWQTNWVPMTVLAAITTAATSWALIAALGMLGWIAVPDVPLTAVLGVATRGWLLAHGVPISLPAMNISLVPLGATAVIIVLAVSFCQLAVRHSKPPLPEQRPYRWLRSGLLFSLVYVVLIAIARAQIVLDGVQNRTFLPTILFLVLLGLGAHVRPLGLRAARPNNYVAPVLRGIAAAWLWMILIGAVVVALALIGGMGRVVSIHEALNPGILGGIMLLLSQLLWLPNFVLWGGAWASGAGIQIGLDTVISPVMTQVGILPAIPVLGVIPDTIAMPPGHIAWVSSGVIAGGLAAWLFLRRLEIAARIDLSALLGAGIGAVAGLVFTASQLLAAGDLGTVRLVWIGARLIPLLVMAATSMGIGGLIVGTIIGIRRSRKPVDDEFIPTSVVVDRRKKTKSAGEISSVVASQISEKEAGAGDNVEPAPSDDDPKQAAGEQPVAKAEASSYATNEAPGSNSERPSEAETDTPTDPPNSAERTAESAEHPNDE